MQFYMYNPDMVPATVELECEMRAMVVDVPFDRAITVGAQRRPGVRVVSVGLAFFADSRSFLLAVLDSLFAIRTPV